MRKIVLTALLSLIPLAALANPIIPVPTQPQPMVIKPVAPDLPEVKGYVLMDADTGKVIAEKNPDLRLAPASLTKLMTMYVVSNALKSGTIHADDKVRISAKAWRTGGSRMFLRVNDEVPVKDLLQGIVIASGNDAAVAMAEYIGGTENAFAGLMNTEAQQLGMKNSHFMDSNGLPNPDHYSTPLDLAILARAIIQNFPEDYKLYSQKWLTYDKIRQPNRNRLLWNFPSADGLKTGHTEAAGYCLVGSAKRDGMRLISVVMGAPSDSARTEDSIRLLTYGFRFFHTQKMFDGGTALKTIRVWKGQKKQIALGIAKTLYVIIPAGQEKNVHTDFQLNTPLKAPIVKGETYGNLVVSAGSDTLATIPLIALENDANGGVWRSMADGVNYHLQHWFSHSKQQANNS